MRSKRDWTLPCMENPATRAHPPGPNRRRWQRRYRTQPPCTRLNREHGKCVGVWVYGCLDRPPRTPTPTHRNTHTPTHPHTHTPTHKKDQAAPRSTPPGDKLWEASNFPLIELLTC